jgi:nucleotidyltransferase/DNA polymerase involved in DNA repair
VANGDAGTGGHAGACLAISYEARGKGIGRGASVREARSKCRDLVIYESCLPLYDMYAELYDKVLEWIVPKEWCYRGSCDEVIIHFSQKRYPFKKPSTIFKETLRFIHEQCGIWIPIRITPTQKKNAHELPSPYNTMLAVSYLIRDAIWFILGLPISISIAPSISLGKTLIDEAKPKWLNGSRSYSTIHDAISFPLSPDQANHTLRAMPIKDLCGVRKVAKRLDEHHAIRKVSQIQDHCSLERTIRLASNKHLGEVIWYACHGRDDILPAYLSAIRDKK